MTARTKKCTECGFNPDEPDEGDLPVELCAIPDCPLQEPIRVRELLKQVRHVSAQRLRRTRREAR